MWLFVGSIICIFFNTGHGVITVNPSTNPMYFAIGAPATIACTVGVPSGNIESSVFAVTLSKTMDPNSRLNCPAFPSSPDAGIISSNLGSVTYNRSYASQSSVTCTYQLSSIEDGRYECGGTFSANADSSVIFDVVTTKKLEVLYFYNDSTITVNDGDLINVSCVATNSKPGYTMSWMPSISNAHISTSNSTTGIYTNSTISLTVAASSDLNRQTLTCLASSSIPDLESSSKTVTFDIIYGPTDDKKNINSANGTFECSLNSNPQVTDYTWQVGNSTLSQCSGQRWCNLKRQEFSSEVQITCEGRNPVTQRAAHVTIDFIWSTISTGAAVTGASKPEDQASQVLTDGAIAGIVIGAVAFIVLVIVVPVVVCSKRKSSKGASTDSERTGNRSSTTPSSSGPSSSRPYSFENTSGGGYKSPLAAQPDVVRNSGFSPSAAEPGQSQKAPSTPPPAYPGAMDVIDQKPRSRKPIALYDTAFDDAYPNQTNASYIPSPKY